MNKMKDDFKFIAVDDIIAGKYELFVSLPNISANSFRFDIRHLGLDINGGSITMYTRDMKESVRGVVCLQKWSKEDWDKYDEYLKSNNYPIIDLNDDFEGDTLSVSSAVKSKSSATTYIVVLNYRTASVKFYRVGKVDDVEEWLKQFTDYDNSYCYYMSSDKPFNIKIDEIMK